MRGTLMALAGLAASGAAVAVVAWPHTRAPLAVGPALALPVVAAHFNTADRMELTQGGQTLRLERRGQSWGLAREGGFPIRPDAAEALIGELETLRLLHPVPGEPAALHVGDPAAPGAGSGTLVRVISVSGDVIGAMVLGGTAATARRPGDPTVFATTPQIALSADPAAWSVRALPAPDGPVTVEQDGGLGAGSVAAALERVRFQRVLAAPQVHLRTTRTIRLVLPDGEALLRIGRFDGASWLVVSGSSRWAEQLAPYAFALPPGAPLAAEPGQSL